MESSGLRMLSLWLIDALEHAFTPIGATYARPEIISPLLTGPVLAYLGTQCDAPWGGMNSLSEKNTYIVLRF